MGHKLGLTQARAVEGPDCRKPRKACTSFLARFASESRAHSPFSSKGIAPTIPGGRKLGHPKSASLKIRATLSTLSPKKMTKSADEGAEEIGFFFRPEAPCTGAPFEFPGFSQISVNIGGAPFIEVFVFFCSHG